MVWDMQGTAMFGNKDPTVMPRTTIHPLQFMPSTDKGSIDCEHSNHREVR
jgi:hypothetical protein